MVYWIFSSRILRIKKYIGRTAAEAKARIKEDYGDDAVILSMREVIVPPNSEKQVEFVVAADKDAPPRPTKEELVQKALAGAKKATQKKQVEPAGQLSPKQVARKAKKAYMKSFESTGGGLPADSSSSMYEIRQILNDIRREMKYKYSGSMSEDLSRLYRHFIDLGIGERLALDTIGQISSRNMNIDYRSAETIARTLLIEDIERGGMLEKRDYLRPVFFIGPTGSGKSSVLTKIAVILKLVLQADVLIVSADSYKVGASEQLETYASIAGLPFKSIYTPEELAETISCENTRDFILVDTTGRSPYRTDHIELLKDYTHEIEKVSTYLVQSASTSSRAFLDALAAYKDINIDSLILTKVDEVRSLGGIVDALIDSGLPLSYMTTGQKIPDDIEPAETEILKKLILP